MRGISLIFIVLTALYGYFVFKLDPLPYLSPVFAGQDARQQLFPLYDAIYPGLFSDDYISRAMSLYMGPLHRFLAFNLTKLTGSPILAGHYIMVIQLGLALFFVFLTTKFFSSIPAACFSVAWFLHTPWLVRNTFGGLPRGWAGLILAAALYFIAKKNHKSVIAVLFLGSFLHPHSTFLASATYGIYLLFYRLNAETRREFKKPFKMFLIAAPFLVALNYFLVNRPADIGEMVTLKQAQKMPAFTKPGGRFPFVPLDSFKSDLETAAFRVFYSQKGKPPELRYLLAGIIAFYLFALFLGLRSGRKAVPGEILIFAAAILISYFLARIFAFRLYVPVRYLAWPPAIFFLISMPVACWRLFRAKNRLVSEWRALLALACLAGVVIAVSGTNLSPTSNYKPGRDFDNPLYGWIRENTPLESSFAGHPTGIDGMQLYGIRKAFITTETAHPFYDKYAAEAERRLEISFRALYARDKQEFLEAIGSEAVDYFVFTKRYFIPAKSGAGLKNARYYLPHKKLVQKLASGSLNDYFYSKLGDVPNAVVYENSEHLVIDLKKLRESVALQHDTNHPE